jgi:hypothetical protein
MKLNDFKFLEQLPTKGVVILKNGKNYAEAIYESNIPYRPGIYLVYSLGINGEEQDLLYYGKAGVTDNNGTPTLNYHQLPKRLVATTSIPSNHPDFEKKKDITRAKLWTWYVENKFVYGIKIYWFIAEWPKQNPNDIERKIKEQIKQKYPKWQKSI